MTTGFLLHRTAVLLLLAAVCVSASAQQRKFPESLDVPFVPTNQPTVDAMLRVAGVAAGDYLIDLGSGDGRIVITAARDYNARGFGVDLDPDRVKESLENARIAGVADRVTFHQRDLFDTDIGKATVVTLYLLPRVNLKLRTRLLAELKAGTRVVSHDFDMGEWKPDLKVSVRGSGSEVYFWVVPARAAGKWSARVAMPQASQSLEIEFTQQFQEIEGTARREGKLVHLRDARLDGNRISFVLVDDSDFLYRQRFDGRISGNAIEGHVRGEGNAPRGQHTWRGTRAGS